MGARVIGADTRIVGLIARSPSDSKTDRLGTPLRTRRAESSLSWLVPCVVAITATLGCGKTSQTPHPQTAESAHSVEVIHQTPQTPSVPPVDAATRKSIERLHAALQQAKNQQDSELQATRTRLLQALDAENARPVIDPSTPGNLTHISVYALTICELMAVEERLGLYGPCLQRGIQLKSEFPSNMLEVLPAEDPIRQEVEVELGACSMGWDDKYGQQHGSYFCQNGGLSVNDTCYSYSPGVFRQDGADIEPAKREALGLNPRITEQPQSQRATRYSMPTHGLPDGLCGGELKNIWEQDGALFFRIGGSFKFCWPGSAAFEGEIVLTKHGKVLGLVDSYLAVLH